jgi:hypothetical protein
MVNPRSIVAGSRATIARQAAVALPGVACLLTTTLLLADDPSGAEAARVGIVVIFSLVALVSVYVYFSLTLKTIAEKTHTENTWWAWVPILQAVLMLSIARKPAWWILLLFIPAVNLGVAVIVWMAIARARNRPGWWGVLMLVPIGNLIVPGYLAWVD